jgi:murein DD-endopeptidase MepM/ murein hydrolase activator NlpD
MSTSKLAFLAAGLILFGVQTASGFDYASYRPADLDEVIEQKRPTSGIDIFPGLLLNITVSLTSYAEPCNVAILKGAMIVTGLKDWIETVPITRCIKVRTAKNRFLSLFIQDKVAESLPKEVSLGSAVTLFATHVFTNPEGPGLLVNEFLAGIRNDPGSSGSSYSAGGQRVPECECGVGFHPGADYSATEGTPIPAWEDGVVVKVEENEQASVDTPTAGRCGRYVVIKHSYPNNRSAFLRYAQLGSVGAEEGKPIAVGMHVRKGDRIGQVGSKQTLHLEVRPVDPVTMDKSANWLRRYGADPTMEWSRFGPVDPVTFDPEAFGSIGTKAK